MSWLARIHAATADVPHDEKAWQQLLIANSALVVAECDGVDIDGLLDRISDDVPRLEGETS